MFKVLKKPEARLPYWGTGLLFVSQTDLKIMLLSMYLLDDPN